MIEAKRVFLGNISTNSFSWDSIKSFMKDCSYIRHWVTHGFILGEESAKFWLAIEDS